MGACCSQKGKMLTNLQQLENKKSIQHNTENRKKVTPEMCRQQLRNHYKRTKRRIGGSIK
jgi:3-methyladenine DNA glycosylase AlkC